MAPLARRHRGEHPARDTRRASVVARHAISLMLLKGPAAASQVVSQLLAREAEREAARGAAVQNASARRGGSSFLRTLHGCAGVKLPKNTATQSVSIP